jgi:hypothetical protein
MDIGEIRGFLDLSNFVKNVGGFGQIIVGVVKKGKSN